MPALLRVGWDQQGYPRVAYALPRRVGVDELRRDVAQRGQHEAALPHARVRQHQFSRVDLQVVDEQQIDVERPRSPAFGAYATGAFFDQLALVEQLEWLELGVDRDDCVEVRILRRSADRRGLVDV